jgi:predicted nucleic acid-binding Zn ribbon protein
MYALKELLKDALSGLMGPRRARQAAVLGAWQEVIGERHARHARALGIRDGTLLVATDLPALYFEIGLRRASLVETLNQRAGGPAIDQIQIFMRPLVDFTEPAGFGETKGRA